MPHAKVHPMRLDQKKPNPQPQQSPAQTPATSVHPTEPEDKKAGNNQQRKVLQMNVGKDGHAEGHPDAAAGQHATGSFTRDAEKENRKR